MNREHFSSMKAGVSPLDALLQKYNDYMRLKDCRAEYKLVNGECMETFFLSTVRYVYYRIEHGKNRTFCFI